MGDNEFSQHPTCHPDVCRSTSLRNRLMKALSYFVGSVIA